MHFAAANWDVRPKCQEKINLVAAWARQHPDKSLLLQGYIEGTEGHRNGLAERRTRAVRDALVAAGVKPSRIEMTSAIGTNPVCVDHSDQCRELNRRVVISAIDSRDTSRLSLVAIDPERIVRGVSAP